MLNDFRGFQRNKLKERPWLRSALMAIASTPPTVTQQREIVSILARGFLRLVETSRQVAVSDADKPQLPLDVLALPGPHVDGNEAA